MGGTSSYLWSDNYSLWVPVDVSFDCCKNIVVKNSSSGQLIAAAKAAILGKIIVFGTLCPRVAWLPPLPQGTPEENLLAIATNESALQNPRKMFWIYFPKQKNLISCLESILDRVQSHQRQRQRQSPQQQQQQQQQKQQPQQQWMEGKEKYAGRLGQDDVLSKLSKFYYGGLSSAWCCTFSAKCSEPWACGDTSAIFVDLSLLDLDRDRVSHVWGKGKYDNWDTRGKNLAYDRTSKSWTTTDSDCQCSPLY